MRLDYSIKTWMNFDLCWASVSRLASELYISIDRFLDRCFDVSQRVSLNELQRHVDELRRAPTNSSSFNASNNSCNAPPKQNGLQLGHQRIECRSHSDLVLFRLNLIQFKYEYWLLTRRQTSSGSFTANLSLPHALCDWRKMKWKRRLEFSSIRFTCFWRLIDKTAGHWESAAAFTAFSVIDVEHLFARLAATILRCHRIFHVSYRVGRPLGPGEWRWKQRRQLEHNQISNIRHCTR